MALIGPCSPVPLAIESVRRFRGGLIGEYLPMRVVNTGDNSHWLRVSTCRPADSGY